MYRPSQTPPLPPPSQCLQIQKDICPLPCLTRRLEVTTAEVKLLWQCSIVFARSFSSWSLSSKSHVTLAMWTFIACTACIVCTGSNPVKVTVSEIKNIPSV
jgi:hypothetical protein